MQVARKSSRRSYGLVLVCLLVLAFTVPRYWQAHNTARFRPASAPHTEPGRHELGEAPFADDPASVASRSRSPIGAAALLDKQLFVELISVPRRVVAESSAPRSEPLRCAVSARAAQWVVDRLRAAGRQFAQCSPDDVVALVGRLADVHQQVEPEAPHVQPAAELPTLQLTNPRERLAMVPTVGPRLPSFSGPADEPAPTSTARQTDDWPWARPAVLVDQLQLLAECPQTATWAQQAIAELESLTGQAPPDRRQTATQIQRLNRLAEEAVRLAGSAQDDQLRVELLRAHWGLLRRADCWSKMCEIASLPADRQRIASRRPLKGLLNGPPDAGAVSVDLDSLGARLEAYEQTGAQSLARSIRAQQLQLLASDNEVTRDLGQSLEIHYRNANVRIAVTAELLNRYLSKERVTAEPVHDCIVGTPVHGRSETLSRSHTQLEPATGLLKLQLQTEGSVNSNTLADGGQAVVHSLSTTDFWVHKPIVVDREGVQSQPTVADAENHAQLVGVRTIYDWIPLVGEYAHAKAVKEYYAKRPQAKAEVECKVTARASRRVEDEAGGAIHRVEQEVRERFTRRLDEYGIEITPIELTTTSRRLVARLRMASDGELGAHSPRPRAPADSLASLQVHQTALTNAAVALDLNGKRLTAPELQKSLRATFPRLAERRPEREVHEDTVFDFADRDAIRFRISEGRVELMIVLKEFVYEGRTTRNFIVHAFYRPEVNGLEAELVRDGGLGIEGRLGAGDRARLYNVFETILPPDRTIPVFHVDNPNAPRLAGLMITQLVLEDGWAGLAIGPASDGRVAQRWRSLR